MQFPNNWFMHGVLLELFQRIQKILIFRNTLLNKPNCPIFVNKVRHSSSTVKLFNLFPLIGDERKINSILHCKFKNRLYTIIADTDNLCIQLYEFFQIPLEGNEFVGSDRCKSGKIERYHNIFPPEIVRKLNVPPGRIPTAIWCSVPNIERKSYCGCQHECQQGDGAS